MWDLPGPGLKPVSLVLAGGFSTTAPPGKPWTHLRVPSIPDWIRVSGVASAHGWPTTRSRHKFFLQEAKIQSLKLAVFFFIYYVQQSIKNNQVLKETRPFGQKTREIRNDGKHPQVI